MATYRLNLSVNGRPVHINVEPHLTLLELLRDNLALTGTKEGCSTGDCGACTVLIDGKPITSCLKLVVEAEGQDVMTVEGLTANGELNPVQKAFISEGGLQCGFCTPGIILSSIALLGSNPQPTEAEIRVSLAGNLCRCTGYHKIVEAVQTAVKEMNHA
jgi:aerobic-type carbon monoxide dehydrogenase small subunit (CoxS/CutS family)